MRVKRREILGIDLAVNPRMTVKKRGKPKDEGRYVFG